MVSHPIFIMGDMREQLVMLESQAPWKLDAKTRNVGRQGIASARAALAKSRATQSHSMQRQAA